MSTEYYLIGSPEVEYEGGETLSLCEQSCKCTLYAGYSGEFIKLAEDLTPQQLLRVAHELIAVATYLGEGLELPYTLEAYDNSPRVGSFKRSAT